MSCPKNVDNSILSAFCSWLKKVYKEASLFIYIFASDIHRHKVFEVYYNIKNSRPPVFDAEKQERAEWIEKFKADFIAAHGYAPSEDYIRAAAGNVMHCYISEAPFRGKASNNPLQGWSKPPVEPAVLIVY